MSFIPEQLRKDLANKFDDTIDFKKIIGGVAGQAAEFIDGKLFAWVIIAIDDRYSKMLPELYKEAVLALLEAFAYNQFERVTDEVTEIIDEMVDLPFLNEDAESKFIYINLQALKDLILFLTTK
jgi:hypothetical protein